MDRHGIPTQDEIERRLIDIISEALSTYRKSTSNHDPREEAAAVVEAFRKIGIFTDFDLGQYLGLRQNSHY